MQSFRVDADGPLLTWLAEATGNRTQVKKWLRDRQISVNGAVAERHDARVVAGDRIEIGAPQRLPQIERIERMEIVHQDDAILVVDKPAGLLTIATDTERSQTAYFKVTSYLKTLSRGEVRPYIVHRLDRETSGLLLFALDEDAKESLQSAWDDVDKRYYAVVRGEVRQPSGTIESYLSEADSFHVYAGPKRRGAKHAVTHYQLLATDGARSLLEVRTETGRKHQIRVQLTEIGHPIVGDDRYGQHKSSERLALHACYLRITHPASSESLEFRSGLPRSLARGFPKRLTDRLARTNAP